MSVLSALIEKEIEQIKDEQTRKVLFLLKEYGELQAGTWNRVIDSKVKKRETVKGEG